jgi:hypothetical protein
MYVLTDAKDEVPAGWYEQAGAFTGCGKKELTRLV